MSGRIIINTVCSNTLAYPSGHSATTNMLFHQQLSRHNITRQILYLDLLLPISHNNIRSPKVRMFIPFIFH